MSPIAAGLHQRQPTEEGYGHLKPHTGITPAKSPTPLVLTLGTSKPAAASGHRVACVRSLYPARTSAAVMGLVLTCTPAIHLGHVPQFDAAPTFRTHHKFTYGFHQNSLAFRNCHRFRQASNPGHNSSTGGTVTASTSSVPLMSLGNRTTNAPSSGSFPISAHAT